MVDERLSQFLSKGKDWERKPTNIPGLFLLKLPALRNRPASIVIEVNPVDTSGSPTKKRGIIIKSNSELVQIRDILTNIKLEQLMKSVEEVNPEVKTVSKSASDIFEI
ncbi:MAG: hypothetical protein WBQ16_00225 [Nitrososphaeraceae archaeon]